MECVCCNNNERGITIFVTITKDISLSWHIFGKTGTPYTIMASSQHVKLMAGRPGCKFDMLTTSFQTLSSSKHYKLHKNDALAVLFIALSPVPVVVDTSTPTPTHCSFCSAAGSASIARWPLSYPLLNSTLTLTLFQGQRRNLVAGWIWEKDMWKSHFLPLVSWLTD